MPGEHNRRTIQFPEAPKTPALIVQITNLKTNQRADRIAAELADKVGEWVLEMVINKMFDNEVKP